MHRFILSLILVFTAFCAMASTPTCDQKCKRQHIEDYFDHLETISRTGSTREDIERLLNHVHDDVKYEHLEYQADFTKVQWRKAFIRQHDRGAYQAGPEREIGILNVIHGKRHVAVEYSYGERKKDGSWQQGDPYFALFGFTDGKISLIREYW